MEWAHKNSQSASVTKIIRKISAQTVPMRLSTTKYLKEVRKTRVLRKRIFFQNKLRCLRKLVSEINVQCILPIQCTNCPKKGELRHETYKIPLLTLMVVSQFAIDYKIKTTDQVTGMEQSSDLLHVLSFFPERAIKFKKQPQHSKMEVTGINLELWKR